MNSCVMLLVTGFNWIGAKQYLVDDIDREKACLLLLVCDVCKATVEMKY